MFVCHKCKRDLQFESRVLRSERCPWCDADLHCCMNCRFWDPSAHNECREIGTELIRERDSANHCSHFEYVEGNRGGDGGEAAAAKKKLESLFKF